MSEVMMPSTPDAVRTVHLPAPTAWPIVLAFGLTLMCAGLVTTVAVTILGTLLATWASVGWFRDVLPVEAHTIVPVDAPGPGPLPSLRQVARVRTAAGLPRAVLPLEIYPVSAGIKGGLVGAVVMALLAMTYGVVSQRSIWYPINLLAAGFFEQAARVSTAEIAAFHLRPLLLASAIHLLTSLLVGVLYGVMLPMMPRHPIVLGGLIGPIFWTGLLYSVLGIVNPVMNQRIHWGWFLLSQVGFGIAAGLVVSRQERMKTSQPLPLAVRAGVEAPGLLREREGGEP
jgi:hypothetical protein